MASNNNDTARYSNKNISPVSLKMAVLMSSSQMKMRFFNPLLTLCKTNIAETFINP